jgi:hypothetical protein
MDHPNAVEASAYLSALAIDEKRFRDASKYAEMIGDASEEGRLIKDAISFIEDMGQGSG